MHPYIALVPVVAIVAFLASYPGLAVESHPGIGVEALYSDAVLSFNKKQHKEALQKLDSLLKENPGHLDALELKALTLKAQGDDASSMGVYQKLIQLKPLKERGPYHFELGVIYNRQKKPDLAREEFSRALQLKFNEIPSHLFIGLIRFNAGDYSQAGQHFEAVKKSENAELRLIAYYYLGMVNFKNGDGASATHELMSARAVAADLKGNKTATDIFAATDKVLEPFRYSSWFANLSVLGQYDSNVAQLPTGLAAANPSGAATPKMLATGGFGRMSPALDTVQWVASYRFSYNKNFNAQTNQLEYFSNQPSFYLNYKPLAATTGGLRVDGTWLFKNEAEVGAGGFKFHQNALNVDVGPYLKTALSRRAQLQADLGYRKQNYISSDELDGNVLYGRLTLKGEGSSRFFNPGMTANYENAKSLLGAESRYNTMGAGVSNVARLTAKDTLTTSVDYLKSTYPDSATSRKDTNISARLNWTRPLTPKMSILGDVTFVKNTSSDTDSYTYNRLMTAVGIGYSL